MRPDRMPEVERGSEWMNPPAGDGPAADHRLLPMLLSQVEWRVQQKLFPGAERCFAEFSFGLERHLANEDRAGSADKSQRETIRRLLSRVGEAIQARDCGGFASSASDLQEAFAAHSEAEKDRQLPS